MSDKKYRKRARKALTAGLTPIITKALAASYSTEARQRPLHGYELARESAQQAIAAREPLPGQHWNPLDRQYGAGFGAAVACEEEARARISRLLAPIGTPDRLPGDLGWQPHHW